MVGMLGSGFRVVSQASGAAFRNIVLSAFRLHARCHPPGVGFKDVVIDGAAGEVRLVQVTGEPPVVHDDQPVAPISFYELTQGYQIPYGPELFDFLSWPLVTRATALQHLKTIDGDGVAIGLGLDAGDDVAAFAAFTANHLTIGGAPRDFLVAINGDVLTGDFVRSVSLISIGVPVPMLSGPRPLPTTFTIVDDSPQGGPVRWQQPWRFVLDVKILIGSDESDVRVHGTAWLEAAGDGGLDIHVSVPPSQIVPGYDDDFWPFTSFDASERDATSAWIAFHMAESARRALGKSSTSVADRPTAVRVPAIGEAVGRVFDPAFLNLPNGNKKPPFFCEGIEITPEGAIVYGAIRLTVLAPHLVIVPETLIFTEKLSSACGAPAAEPEFDDQVAQLRNVGQGPLDICTFAWSGPDTSKFRARVNSAGDVVAGDFRELVVSYHGARGVNATATLTVTSNDLSRPHYPIELRALSGQASFAIDPAALSVRRANNPMGRPVMRVANCQPQPVRENAAEFRVINLGAVPLHICGLALDDPDDVFVIPFFQRIVDPGSADVFSVLFFPKEAGHTYFATCTLTFGGGQQHALQIDGLVEVLPQPGEPGEWIDLGAGRGCFALEGLCRARSHFSPVTDSGVLPIVETMVEGLPPDAELLMRDGQGRVHVRDMSGLPDRTHALAYTPNPDGGALPGDPCRGEVPGVGPVGPDPGPDPIMVDVEGWLIRPEGEPFDIGLGSLFVTDNLPRLARSDGLWTVDPRQERLVPLKVSQKIDRLDGLVIRHGQAVLLAGDRVSLHDAGLGGIGARRADARLDHTASGILLHGQHVLAADDRGVFIFAEDGKQLKQIARATLPGGVRAMRNVLGGVVALGNNVLTFVTLGKNGAPRIATTIKLEDATTLLPYRSMVLVADKNATRSYGIVEGRLRHLADYPLGHWSTSYLPGGADDLLLKRIDAQHLQRCRVKRHDFDRRKFAEAFDLHYRPTRP